MSLLPFLHFFCFSVYMILAVYVLAKNAKSPLNRVCSVLFMSFGIWSFGSIFLHSPRTARDAAYLFENIAALGWGSFPVIFLWFVLIFTKRARILGSKLFYAAIAVLPALFIYKQWSGLIIGDYVFRSYGWSGVWSSSPWAYLYFVYYSLFCGMGLYFLTKYSQHIDSPIIQKRIKAIFWATIASFTLASLTDVILPTFSISAIPDIADLFGLIWAFGIVYSIARYRFLAMTPSTAADSIISTMTDCLVLLNRECGIVTVNRAVLDLLHYAKNDLEGARAEKLFEDNQENKDLLKKIEKGEGVRNRDIFLRTKHGKDIPVIFSSSVLWDGDGNIVGTVCIANDITDRKKWEEELRHAHSKLEARVKERTADLMTANERLQREVAERKRIETSLRESQEKYSTLIEKGNDAIIIVQDGVVKFANSKMREFTGISVEKVIGRPFVDFISPAFRKLTYDMYSQRVSRKDVPARYEIKVLSKDGKEIPVEISASLIEYEGKIASMGIIRDMTERKSTEEELKRSYKQLEKIIESIIYAMARIVEVRDPYTAGHQQRVAVLACAIAKEMGMEDDRIKGIHMAAVIHDIGKISIPGEILSKPGRLSKLEFGIIQAHSQMGYDVLKSIDFPWPIAQMILQHHERRDGSGYPSGMHQKNILLEAEIISVADVVEAMTSHRPYRPALGPEKALQEISQRKGEIYHPDVVDACLKLFREKGFKFEA